MLPNQATPRRRTWFIRASALLVSGVLSLACSCGSEAPAATSSSSGQDSQQGDTASAPGSQASVTSGTATVPKATSGAKLRFKNLTHDFGAVDDTDELIYEFEFTNEGSETLHITDIKPSCGCTTTELKKRVYEPGEEGAIELIFHPKGYGPQTKTITVKSDSSGSERIIVFIKSTVTPFVQFEPRSVRFADVPTAEGREEEITVTCRDSGAIFGSPQCSNPNFTVEWTVPPTNGTGKFTVRLRPGAPKGNVINKVRFDVQGVPKVGAESIRHKAEFSASAAVFGAIIIDPIFLSVGRIDLGGRIDKSLELRRPNDLPFKILASELKNSSISGLSLTVTPNGAGYTVRVQGDVGAYQGLVRGQAVITTNVPEDPTLIISVMGAVRVDPKK